MFRLQGMRLRLLNRSLAVIASKTERASAIYSSSVIDGRQLQSTHGGKLTSGDATEHTQSRFLRRKDRQVKRVYLPEINDNSKQEDIADGVPDCFDGGTDFVTSRRQPQASVVGKDSSRGSRGAHLSNSKRNKPTDTNRLSSSPSDSSHVVHSSGSPSRFTRSRPLSKDSVREASPLPCDFSRPSTENLSPESVVSQLLSLRRANAANRYSISGRCRVRNDLRIFLFYKLPQSLPSVFSSKASSFLTRAMVVNLPQEGGGAAVDAHPTSQPAQGYRQPNTLNWTVELAEEILLSYAEFEFRILPGHLGDQAAFFLLTEYGKLPNRKSGSGASEDSPQFSAPDIIRRAKLAMAVHQILEFGRTRILFKHVLNESEHLTRYLRALKADKEAASSTADSVNSQGDARKNATSSDPHTSEHSSMEESHESDIGAIDEMADRERLFCISCAGYYWLEMLYVRELLPRLYNSLRRLCEFGMYPEESEAHRMNGGKAKQDAEHDAEGVKKNAHLMLSSLEDCPFSRHEREAFSYLTSVFNKVLGGRLVEPISRSERGKESAKDVVSSAEPPLLSFVAENKYAVRFRGPFECIREEGFVKDMVNWRSKETACALELPPQPPLQPIPLRLLLCGLHRFTLGVDGVASHAWRKVAPKTKANGEVRNIEETEGRGISFSTPLLPFLEQNKSDPCVKAQAEKEAAVREELPYWFFIEMNRYDVKVELLIPVMQFFFHSSSFSLLSSMEGGFIRQASAATADRQSPVAREDGLSFTSQESVDELARETFLKRENAVRDLIRLLDLIVKFSVVCTTYQLASIASLYARVLSWSFPQFEDSTASVLTSEKDLSFSRSKNTTPTHPRDAPSSLSASTRSSQMEMHTAICYGVQRFVLECMEELLLEFSEEGKELNSPPQKHFFNREASELRYATSLAPLRVMQLLKGRAMRFTSKFSASDVASFLQALSKINSVFHDNRPSPRQIQDGGKGWKPDSNSNVMRDPSSGSANSPNEDSPRPFESWFLRMRPPLRTELEALLDMLTTDFFLMVEKHLYFSLQKQSTRLALDQLTETTRSLGEFIENVTLIEEVGQTGFRPLEVKATADGKTLISRNDNDSQGKDLNPIKYKKQSGDSRKDEVNITQNPHAFVNLPLAYTKVLCKRKTGAFFPIYTPSEFLSALEALEALSVGPNFYEKLKSLCGLYLRNEHITFCGRGTRELTAISLKWITCASKSLFAHHSLRLLDPTRTSTAEKRSDGVDCGASDDAQLVAPLIPPWRIWMTNLLCLATMSGSLKTITVSDVVALCQRLRSVSRESNDADGDHRESASARATEDRSLLQLPADTVILSPWSSENFFSHIASAEGFCFQTQRKGLPADSKEEDPLKGVVVDFPSPAPEGFRGFSAQIRRDVVRNLLADVFHYMALIAASPTTSSSFNPITFYKLNAPYILRVAYILLGEIFTKEMSLGAFSASSSNTFKVDCQSNVAKLTDECRETLESLWIPLYVILRRVIRQMRALGLLEFPLSLQAGATPPEEGSELNTHWKVFSASIGDVTETKGYKMCAQAWALEKLSCAFEAYFLRLLKAHSMELLSRCSRNEGVVENPSLRSSNQPHGDSYRNDNAPRRAALTPYAIIELAILLQDEKNDAMSPYISTKCPKKGPGSIQPLANIEILHEVLQDMLSRSLARRTLHERVLLLSDLSQVFVDANGSLLPKWVWEMIKNAILQQLPNAFTWDARLGMDSLPFFYAWTFLPFSHPFIHFGGGAEAELLDSGSISSKRAEIQQDPICHDAEGGSLKPEGDHDVLEAHVIRVAHSTESVSEREVRLNSILVAGTTDAKLHFGSSHAMEREGNEGSITSLAPARREAFSLFVYQSILESQTLYKLLWILRQLYVMFAAHSSRLSPSFTGDPPSVDEWFPRLRELAPLRAIQLLHADPERRIPFSVLTEFFEAIFQIEFRIAQYQGVPIPTLEDTRHDKDSSPNGGNLTPTADSISSLAAIVHRFSSLSPQQIPFAKQWVSLSSVTAVLSSLWCLSSSSSLSSGITADLSKRLLGLFSPVLLYASEIQLRVPCYNELVRLVGLLMLMAPEWILPVVSASFIVGSQGNSNYPNPMKKSPVKGGRRATRPYPSSSSSLSLSGRNGGTSVVQTAAGMLYMLIIMDRMKTMPHLQPQDASANPFMRNIAIISDAARRGSFSDPCKMKGSDPDLDDPTSSQKEDDFTPYEENLEGMDDVTQDFENATPLVDVSFIWRSMSQTMYHFLKQTIRLLQECKWHWRDQFGIPIELHSTPVNDSETEKEQREALISLLARVMELELVERSPIFYNVVQSTLHYAIEIEMGWADLGFVVDASEPLAAETSMRSTNPSSRSQKGLTETSTASTRGKTSQLATLPSPKVVIALDDETGEPFQLYIQPFQYYFVREDLTLTGHLSLKRKEAKHLKGSTFMQPRQGSLPSNPSFVEGVPTAIVLRSHLHLPPVLRRLSLEVWRRLLWRGSEIFPRYKYDSRLRIEAREERRRARREHPSKAVDTSSPASGLHPGDPFTFREVQLAIREHPGVADLARLSSVAVEELSGKKKIAGIANENGEFTHREAGGMGPLSFLALTTALLHRYTAHTTARDRVLLDAAAAAMRAFRGEENGADFTREGGSLSATTTALKIPLLEGFLDDIFPSMKGGCAAPRTALSAVWLQPWLRLARDHLRGMAAGNLEGILHEERNATLSQTPKVDFDGNPEDEGGDVVWSSTQESLVNPLIRPSFVSSRVLRFDLGVVASFLRLLQILQPHLAQRRLHDAFLRLQEMNLTGDPPIEGDEKALLDTLPRLQLETTPPCGFVELILWILRELRAAYVREAAMEIARKDGMRIEATNFSAVLDFLRRGDLIGAREVGGFAKNTRSTRGWNVDDEDGYDGIAARVRDRLRWIDERRLEGAVLELLFALPDGEEGGVVKFTKAHRVILRRRLSHLQPRDLARMFSLLMQPVQGSAGAVESTRGLPDESVSPTTLAFGALHAEKENPDAEEKALDRVLLLCEVLMDLLPSIPGKDVVCIMETVLPVWRGLEGGALRVGETKSIVRHELRRFLSTIPTLASSCLQHFTLFELVRIFSELHAPQHHDGEEIPKDCFADSLVSTAAARTLRLALTPEFYVEEQEIVRARIQRLAAMNSGKLLYKEWLRILSESIQGSKEVKHLESVTGSPLGTKETMGLIKLTNMFTFIEVTGS
ncbi:unnamed protein product [Phytomonas sp. EM1]|nr:unnamed protein product [Phytomonas sp. EM1]|eukprot:CCW61089.1 unnamed protein product [Phytomonas sp. isolate EM1]